MRQRVGCWRWLPFAAAALLWVLAMPARAGDDVAPPQLPCGAEPYPPLAAPGAPPNVRAWRGAAARDWQPPACTGWTRSGFDILVGVAGSFRHDGEIDALLARAGGYAAKKNIRYWSVTEKAWKPLVTEVWALNGADPAQRRADFTAAEVAKGRELYFAQSDNRSSAKAVYRDRVLQADRERLMVARENITPVKMMLITLFEPGDLQIFYVVERRAPGVWGFYGLTRTRMASSLLPLGDEGSYVNRAVAFYRHMAGIPTDQEPPAVR